MFAPPAAELDQFTDRDITIQDFLAYWIDIQKRLRQQLPDVAVAETEAEEIVLPDSRVFRPRTARGFGFVFYSPTRGTRVLDGVVMPDECLRAAHAYFDHQSPDATGTNASTFSFIPRSGTVTLTGKVMSTDALRGRLSLAGDDGRLSEVRSSGSGEYLGFAGEIGGRTEMITGDDGLARVHVGDRIEIRGRNSPDGTVEANRVTLLGRLVQRPPRPRPTGNSGCTNFRDSGALPLAKKYYLSIELFDVNKEQVMSAISSRGQFSHNIQILSVDARRGIVRAKSDLVPGAQTADWGRDYPIRFVTETTSDGTKLSMELDLLWGQFCTNGNAKQVMCDTLRTIASEVAPLARESASSDSLSAETASNSTVQPLSSHMDSDIESAATASGIYVNRRNSTDYMQLNPDGTFFVVNNGKRFDGTYRVRNETITLTSPYLDAIRRRANPKIEPLKVVVRASGNTLADPNGTVWEKQTGSRYHGPRQWTTASPPY